VKSFGTLKFANTKYFITACRQKVVVLTEMFDTHYIKTCTAVQLAVRLSSVFN
jgi:hypothetical protein